MTIHLSSNASTVDALLALSFCLSSVCSKSLSVPTFPVTSDTSVFIELIRPRLTSSSCWSDCVILTFLLLEFPILLKPTRSHIELQRNCYGVVDIRRDKRRFFIIITAPPPWRNPDKSVTREVKTRLQLAWRHPVNAYKHDNHETR